MPRISSKNQITIPVDALRDVGLGPGDDVVVEVDDHRQLVIRRLHHDRVEAVATLAGCLTGVYPPGYLDDLDAVE